MKNLTARERLLLVLSGQIPDRVPVSPFVQDEYLSYFYPKKTEIEGRPVYRSVAELPGSPDAAYIGVNRHTTIDIIRDLAARDAGGAICYATGFIEAGDEGSELERRLLEASGDMPLIGPNCYGFLNYLDGAMLWPDQQGGRRVDEGVAIITMSSNIGFNLTMQRRGLPIAYLASLGNRLKFDLHDAIHLPPGNREARRIETEPTRDGRADLVGVEVPPFDRRGLDDLIGQGGEVRLLLQREPQGLHLPQVPSLAVPDFGQRTGEGSGVPGELRPFGQFVDPGHISRTPCVDNSRMSRRS